MVDANQDDPEWKTNCPWSDQDPRDVRISKAITQVLRHSAIEYGIHIRPDGFSRVDEVVTAKWLQELACTAAEAEEVVKNTEKKRIELREEGGEIWIRAQQEHSLDIVDDSLVLTQLEAGQRGVPRICMHGTYYRHFDSIMAEGLVPGGRRGTDSRRHIHFTAQAQVVSNAPGLRDGMEILIHLDLARALKEGIPFFMSGNGVILSPGVEGCIETKYFTKVIDLMTNELLWTAPARRRGSGKSDASPPGD